jgi:outer membrane protein assembly factor BamA
MQDILKRKSGIWPATIALLLMSSCSTTKYVSGDQYLLNDYKIKTDNRKVDVEELSTYIRQKPNKKILLFKFHLGVYNLSKPDKDNGFNNYLRRIGEAPVIYDESVKDKSVNQLELFLRKKGYYKAEVTDSVIIDKKKASIVYTVAANKPYTIRKVNYRFEDPGLSEFVLKDTVNSLLKKNSLLDEDALILERERIETVLKGQGYFRFFKEFIYFSVDTSLRTYQTDVTMVFKKYREEGFDEEIPHPRYRIREVYINTNYDLSIALSDRDLYESTLDTTRVKQINIIYSGRENIKPGIVIESNYLLPGQLYDVNNEIRTNRNLGALKLFRLVDIGFTDSGELNSDGEWLIDCSILLTPSTLQSYTIDNEVTNSSGNIGAAGSLNYQHRNLFKGAENLDMRLKGAIETLEGYSGNLAEVGAEVKITFPKFLLPFRTDQFIKKFNPSTSLLFAYNFQRRPEFTRTVANASFGYVWRGNRNLTHTINPVELNLVKIPFRSAVFLEWLENEGKNIFYSYQPHLILNTNYGLTFTNQNIQKARDFVFVKYNVESAGNLLYSLYKTAGIKTDSLNYELFNVEFAQYVKSDIDFRYYNIIDENNSIVYRIFAGAGVPYANSTAMPFEKKYFSGGANSIRAWQVRSLGPGSYLEKKRLTYPIQTGDIKLEANIEYRFKLFWVIEGALFVDAGNVWAVDKSDQRPGALFTFDNFYRDIAVGTGIGTRFDFSFFLFRLDIGLKTRNPVLAEGEKWIFGNRKITTNDLQLNIGIGYPF